MSRLKRHLPAIAVFCLALLVRVVYNNTVARDYYPLHDALFYQVIGTNLVNEHCFCLSSHVLTVDRAPLWPFILAIIAFFFGPNNYLARLFLSFIGSGTCLLIYLFARDLFGERIGLVAGIMGIIYPELYIYDGWLYTESLYIFLLFGVCYGLYRLQRRATYPRKADKLAVGCGVLMGLLSLTRPNGVVVIGLCIFWAMIMWWERLWSLRRGVAYAVITTCTALILIAPWTVRNYEVSHAFIPVATGDGTVLLGAYNDDVLAHPGYLGSWINPLVSSPAVTKPFPLFTCAPTCEVARETAYKDQALQWIRDHISVVPYLLKLHFLNLWQPDTFEADLPVDRFPNQPSSQAVLLMMKTFPIAIFMLAAAGFLLTLRRWRELLFVYLMILMTIAECLVFYGSARFRAPIEPMLILLAAGTIWWLTEHQVGTLWWILAGRRKRDQKRHFSSIS